MLHSLLKGVTSTVKASLEESLVQILSPRRRIDILRDAMDAKKRGKPFSITFCGVNGVGKSTNLAKVKHGAHFEETCPISLSSGWKRLEIQLSTFHAKEKKTVRASTGFQLPDSNWALLPTELRSPLP